MKVTTQPPADKKKKPTLHANMKTKGSMAKKNKKLSQQSVDAMIKVVNSPQGIVKKVRKTEILHEQNAVSEKKINKKKNNKVLQKHNATPKDVILGGKSILKNVNEQNENVKQVKSSHLGDKVMNQQSSNSKMLVPEDIKPREKSQDRKKVLKAKNLENKLNSFSGEIPRKRLSKENQPKKDLHKSKSGNFVDGGIVIPKKTNTAMTNKDSIIKEKKLHQELCRTILPARRLMEIVRELTLSTSETLNYSWAVACSDLLDQFPSQLQVVRVFLHHLQTVVYRGCLRIVEYAQQQPHLIRPDVVASVRLLYTKLIRLALQDEQQEFCSDLVSLSGMVAAAWIDLALFGGVDVPLDANGSEDVVGLAKDIRSSVLRNLSCPNALEGGLDALLRSVYLRVRSNKNRKLVRLLFSKYLQRVMSWNSNTPLADAPVLTVPVYTKLLCAIKHLHNSQAPKNVSGFLARFLDVSPMPRSPPGLFAWSRSKNLTGSFVSSKVSPVLVTLRTMQVDPVLEAVYSEQYGSVSEEDESSDSKPDKTQTKPKKKKEEPAKPSSNDGLVILRHALREERQSSLSTAGTQPQDDASVIAGKKRKNSVSVEELQGAADDDENAASKPKTKKKNKKNKNKKKKLVAEAAEESLQSNGMKKKSSDGSTAGDEGDCETEGVDTVEKKKKKNRHHKYIRKSKKNRAMKKRAAAALAGDSSASDGTEETEPASKKVRLDQAVDGSKSTNSDQGDESSSPGHSERLVTEGESKSGLSEGTACPLTLDVEDSIESVHETIDLSDTPVKFTKGKSMNNSRSATTNYDSDGSDIVVVEEVQNTGLKAEKEEEEESDDDEDSSVEEDVRSEKYNEKKNEVFELDDEEEELHAVDENNQMFTDKAVRKHNKKMRRKLEMLRRQDKENTMRKEQEAAKLEAEKERAKRQKALAFDWTNYKQVVKPRKGGLSNQCNDLLNSMYKKKSAEQLAQQEHEKEREKNRLETYEQSLKKIKAKAKKELIKLNLGQDKVNKTKKLKEGDEAVEKQAKKKNRSRKRKKTELEVIYSNVPDSASCDDIKPGLQEINSEKPPSVKRYSVKKPLSDTLDQVCVAKMYKNKEYGKFLAGVVTTNKAEEYKKEMAEKISAEFGIAKEEAFRTDDSKLDEAKSGTAAEVIDLETDPTALDEESQETVDDREDAVREENVLESEDEDDEDYVEDAVSDEKLQESEDDDDYEEHSDSNQEQESDFDEIEDGEEDTLGGEERQENEDDMVESDAEEGEVADSDGVEAEFSSPDESDGGGDEAGQSDLFTAGASSITPPRSTRVAATTPSPGIGSKLPVPFKPDAVSSDAVPSMPRRLSATSANKEDMPLEAATRTSKDSDGVDQVEQSPSAHEADSRATAAAASRCKGSPDNSANRLAKYTEQEGEELEIHSGDSLQDIPKNKRSPKVCIARMETAPVIGPSKRKSMEHVSSTPSHKKSRLSLSSVGRASPLQLSMSEINERAKVCSDVNIELSRSIQTSPRLVSSAALTSEVLISPDLSDEEAMAGNRDEDLFSDNDEMVVDEAFANVEKSRSPMRPTREEQEESDPIDTKKDTRSKTPAKLFGNTSSTTPESRKKAKLSGSVSKADNNRSSHSLLDSPVLLKSSSKKTPSKTVESSASPTLKLSLDEDISAKAASPEEKSVSGDATLPIAVVASVSASTDSVDIAVKQATRRLTRRSSSICEPANESAVASSESTSSSSEVFSSVTNIEAIRELDIGGIATRTRRRSVSSVSNADDTENSNSGLSATTGASVASRTRRRSISDLDSSNPNTPVKKGNGGAPSSLIGTIIEEDDGEDSASGAPASTTKSRPPPTTVATRRRSILSTPQKSSPRQAASSLTQELLAEENAIPSSPTIGGRTRRTSLSGAPVAGVASSPASATPRRRSLAVRSTSAAKSAEPVTSSPARRVSKMKPLSESPERPEEEEQRGDEEKKEEITDTKKTAEQGQAKDGEAEKKEVEKSTGADSTASEVSSVSGDSASGDAPRRALRLRRQPITYK